MRNVFYSFIAVVVLCCLVGCSTATTSENITNATTTTTASTKGNQDSTSTTTSTSTTESTNPSTNPSTEAPIEITGVTFSNGEFPYDGNSHSITVSGTLPSGVSAEYTNNTKTEIGLYNASVILSGTGYITKTLYATLNITKGNITGISMDNVEFDYDGIEHSISVTGVMPEGSSINYSCSEDDSITNTAISVGTYTITATITNSKYNTLQLTKTLKIKTTDDVRSMYYSTSEGLFFQNALDDDKLYCYDGTNIEKISDDKAQYINYIDDSLIYQSKGILSSSIKQYTFTDESENVIYSTKADYILTTTVSGNEYIYYSVNSLLNSNSGIYKIDANGSETIVTKIFTGKSYYLQMGNNEIYFANGANDKKLSSINLSTNSVTLLVDKSISALTYDSSSNTLFYNVNNTIQGDYIEKYIITTSTTRKLTSDSGCDLCLVGSYLYYINKDLFTSNFIGKGIYKVNANPTEDNNSIGTQVIDASTHGVCSLYYPKTGLDIFYYDVENYDLIIYNTSTEQSENILEGFTLPVSTPLSLGGKILEYKGNLYYLDLYNGKALYSYNIVTGYKHKITSNKVTDFSIIGSKLYFNQVSKGVDNDLYMIDLGLGGEPVLISTNDASEIISDGTYLYYVESNAAGVATAIHRANMDGSSDTVIYDTGAHNLIIYEGKLYFIVDKSVTVSYGFINSLDLSNVANVIELNEYETSSFDIKDGTIYFRELYSIGWSLKRLASVNIDGTSDYTILITDNTDPILVVADDNIYYFNYAESALSYAGLWVINEDGTNPTNLLNSESIYYPNSIFIKGDKIYFMNFLLGGTLGDSHLYVINKDGTSLRMLS